MTRIGYPKGDSAELSFLAALAAEKENDMSLRDWSLDVVQRLGWMKGNLEEKKAQKKLMRDELNRIKKEHDINKPIVICSNDLLKMIKNRLYRGTSIGNHRMYGINTANEICREQDWLVHSVCVQNYSEKLYLFSNNNLSKGEMKLFWSNNKNIINKRTPPWELIYEKQD